ncbi:High-affinity branched-chain amino acid transport system permease protein LivH [Pandoraea eparura]|uniref:High-affinity branched-chain amino acid transport system permease protein LivH n=1 Tax=Pandoraea eparura TaxID=2508291 RepID=A0A5E4TZ97_9BURK|nr:branched-chain amino acid ABC transporter permease [Pandoraea eparura]VVD93165.1 High-affinity branched-chain amino acid transport system permease protein LivH [Pandoraea eparura]
MHLLSATAGLVLVNGVSYGLLLFMLSSGLTLIFSMLGVLNFAHASFYMLGAYFAYTFSAAVGFWPALIAAPLIVGAIGAGFERGVLRRLRARGALAELLATFGLAYIVVELVQLAWGRGPVDYGVPAVFEGVLVPVAGIAVPAYRLFLMGLACAIALIVWAVFRATRAGWILQAALAQPAMTQALGYDVPALYTGVFACGAALAALAGAAGGNVLVTEPGMAATVGSVVFVVVVVGGLGSLGGAFAASLLIGLLQTWAVTSDASLAQWWPQSVAGANGAVGPLGTMGAVRAAVAPLLHLSVAQLAPAVPYLLMVSVLLWRARGLSGVREG